jgi:ubiquinol-cytochrome c reductase iron-sulfur subunit
VGVIFAAIPFLSAFKPSARAEAAGAPVKVNISKLSPGELMTVEWRGMPVFVYKVSSEAQNALSADKSKLADPNSDQQQQPDYAQNDTRSRKMVKPF